MIVPTPPVRPVSPSQIATFIECERKWAWRHIAKIVLPAHKSAALGTDTHSQLEEYLKNGTTFDYTRPSGYIADSAVHLLPPPKTQGLELEKHFTFLSAQGHAYHGYMDVMGPDSRVFPNMPTRNGDISTFLNQTWHIFDKKTGLFWDGDKWTLFTGYVEVSRTSMDADRDMVEIRRVGEGTPFVSDHKTTSDFRYAKTADDLRKDPQGIIYAMAAMEHFKSNEVDLIWTYMLTKGARKAKRVHLHVLRADVEKEFAKIEFTVSRIVTTHAAGTSPLDLPPNTSACSAYGGCPYRAHCTDLSSVNIEGKKMSQETSDFLDSMTKKLPANEQPPMSVAPGATNLPVQPILPPPMPKTSEDLFAGLLPSAPTQEQLAQVPARTGPGVNPHSGAPSPTHVDLDVAINPPGEPESVGSTMLPTPEPVAPKAKKTPKSKKNLPVVGESGSAATDVYHQISEPATLPAPADEGHKNTLYVNSFPQGEAYALAETFFAEAAKQLREQGTEDYRMVDFGKGSGIFSALVRDIVEARLARSQCDVVIDSSTPEGSLCLASMSTQFDRVVRSMR